MVNTNTFKFILMLLFCITGFMSKASCIYAKDIEVKELEIGNMLQWETTMEQNNEYFAVMRSSNGVDFEMIGKVKGVGNSSQAVKYQYLDIQQGQNRTFYKLQQLDFDGTASDSHTFLINRKIPNNFIIDNMSSTITNDFIRMNVISNASGNASYEVKDSANEILIKESLSFLEGENIFTINLSNLSNANYTLCLNMEEETDEIMIQKVHESQLPSIRYFLAKKEE